MDKEVFSVSELSKLIKTTLEPNFRNVLVQGEISNLRKTNYGEHLYFTLKDEGALIKAVIFGYLKRYINFELKEGMKVIVRADLNVYEKRGEYQLIVRSVIPQGIGALKMAYEQLKKKLEKEGLFDEKYKKKIPVLPRRIGVVTSITGAAIRDIISVLRRRFHNVEIVIRPVKVQGEGAAEDIAMAIKDFNKYGKVDVLIVGRGGGSFEDLFAFNEEVVARAIFESEIPVISAVGHERDFSISDFVADLRAPTPSAAAELVVKNKLELEATIDYLMGSIKKSIIRILNEKRAAVVRFRDRFLEFLPQHFFANYRLMLTDFNQRIVDAYNAKLVLFKKKLHEYQIIIVNNSPLHKLHRMRERLNSIYSEIIHNSRLAFRSKKERLSILVERLNAYSPLNTLSRGYSITQDAAGRVIKSVEQVNKGDNIISILAHGRIFSKVEKTEVKK